MNYMAFIRFLRSPDHFHLLHSQMWLAAFEQGDGLILADDHLMHTGFRTADLNLSEYMFVFTFR